MDIKVSSLITRDLPSRKVCSSRSKAMKKNLGGSRRHKCSIAQAQGLSDTAWVHRPGVREMEITDEVAQFSLKDLVEQI